tara:strand:+ start:3930 stop:4130 length:201 start_codon:yes stop_codon:yes gene_type:complete
MSQLRLNFIFVPQDGSLARSPNGEMWVKKTRASMVSMHVKHMSEDEFPSYAELEKKDVCHSLYLLK